MKLNLDLPKYKWQILLNHLRHYREDETVNTFCCVIEGLESDKQFPMKMYQFLLSHEDLNPLIFPTVRDIQQKNGGPGIIKKMYQIYESTNQARKEYYSYISENFKMVKK